MDTKVSLQLAKRIDDMRARLRQNEQLLSKKRRRAASDIGKKLKKETSRKMFIVGRMAIEQLSDAELRTTLDGYLTSDSERELFGLRLLEQL